MKLRRLPLLACGLLLACSLPSCYPYTYYDPPPPPVVVAADTKAPVATQVVTAPAPVRREIVYVERPVVYSTRYVVPSYGYGYCPPPVRYGCNSLSLSFGGSYGYGHRHCY